MYASASANVNVRVLGLRRAIIDTAVNESGVSFEGKVSSERRRMGSESSYI